MLTSLSTIHSYSGKILSLFVVMHLFNHAASVWGEDAHIQLMEELRKVYRHPVAETLLMVAVGVQVSSGLRLFTQRRKEAISGVHRLRLWTGFYLAIFLIIHLGAVWVGRLFLHLDTNYYFGVAGLNSFPVNLFFVPYYTLAVLCFFGHLATIHAIKMKRTFWGISPAKQAIVLFMLGVSITILLLYGLTNHFKGVSIPEEYQVLTGKSLVNEIDFRNSLNK